MQQDELLRSTKPKTGKKGNLFIIDHNQFLKAVRKGMNAGISYLVIARGSDKSNTTSEWSVHAIERYAGVSRGNAKKAVTTLIEEKLITKRERRGQGPIYKLQKSSKKAPKIWLPNELIDGTGKGEEAPISRLRRTGDPLTLRLFIEFYSGQDLAEHGGISRAVAMRSYRRVYAGSRSRFQVWAFTAEQEWVNRHPITKDHFDSETTPEEDKLFQAVDDGILDERDIGDFLEEYAEREPLFFKRLAALSYAGLIEEVPYLFESSSPDSEIIHLYGNRTDAENRLTKEQQVTDFERFASLGFFAHEAGRAMITESQFQRAIEELGDPDGPPLTQGQVDLVPLEGH